jgi:hypothetical protein
MYTWLVSELSSLKTITSLLFAFVLESHAPLSTIDRDGRQANYLYTTFYAELQLLCLRLNETFGLLVRVQMQRCQAA